MITAFKTNELISNQYSFQRLTSSKTTINIPYFQLLTFYHNMDFLSRIISIKFFHLIDCVINARKTREFKILRKAFRTQKASSI